ncbi:MAG: hypothetical protein ACRCZ0_09750 [Cetobacterium sp.]
MSLSNNTTADDISEEILEGIIEKINLPNSGLMYASIHDINRIMKLLSPVVTNEKIINFILRIVQQNLKDVMCIEIFSKLLLSPTFQICKNLYLRVLTVILASPDATNEIVNKAFDKIDQIFDESDDETLKANAADIMLNYYPSRGERMLNILRNQGFHTRDTAYERANEQQDQGENLLNMIRLLNDRVVAPERLKPKILIYNDRENVHNSALNASIISACRSIINMMITSVIFDGKYKIMVYEEDSIETIKNKLLSVLINIDASSPLVQGSKQIKIYGDNRQEQLQNKMTFEIVDSGSSNCLQHEACRRHFDIKDTAELRSVLYHNSFTFPEHINREGDKGRLLEEAFIATNRWLNFVSEESEEELVMYLYLTNIEDADIIWLRREKIQQELKQLIECPEVDNFLAKIQNHLFPLDESKTKIFKKIKEGSLMEMELHEILNAVWKFINNKENKSQGIHIQMIERLKEELEDSANVCCSGVAARLISSIQGFFDVNKYPSLKIKISIDDEMKSKINTLISQKALTLEIDPLYDINEFKKMVDVVIEENTESMMSEFTSQDIALNGINKENILRLAYDLYNIKD